MKDGARADDEARSDAVYPADPLGLLESVPELERFLSDRRVRGAIERGRPNDLYRALFWARWRGSFPDDRDTLAMLLSKRRLFVAPMNGAPVLQTINGVGAKIYGEAERGEDYAFVGTHYFVFFFVPIFPIASYLMAHAGANAYRFFGRAPFDMGHWLWNRLVVFGVLGSVLAGLMLSIGAVRHGRITVVNGLPFAVTASLRAGEEPEQRFLVPPHEHRTVEVPAGDCVFAAFGGGELSSGHVTVAGGSHHTVWNVLGVAPLYLEEVVYSTRAGGSDGAAPEIYCGRELIDVGRVDYFLVDPPASISLSSRRSVERRSHFALASPEELDCVWERAIAGDERVPALIDAMARGLDYEPEATIALMEGLELTANRDAAMDVARAMRDRHGDGPMGLEVHRTYQRWMLRGGDRDALRAEYEARALERDDADSHFLYLRVLRPSDAVDRYAALSERFPEHPLLTMTHALQLCDAGAFAEGSARFDEASRWPEVRESEWVVERARCLFAADRRRDAVLLLEQAFEASEGFGEQLVLASVHELLSRALEPSESSALFDDLLDDVGSAPGWEAVYAALVGRTPSDEAMRAIGDPEMASLVAALVHARRDPRAAVEALANVPPYLRRAIPLGLEVLLLAEAARARPGSAAALWPDSRVHPDEEVVEAFVATGTATDAFESLPRYVRAASYFVRSRSEGLDEESRAAARERAYALDVMPSWIGAAENWSR